MQQVGFVTGFGGEEGRSRGHWRRKLKVEFLLLEQFGIWSIVLIENTSGDFPGSPVVKNSPSNAGVGSIPGPGAKISRALGSKNQNIKQKQCCNKFNKDVKNGPAPKIF